METTRVHLMPSAVTRVCVFALVQLGLVCVGFALQGAVWSAAHRAGLAALGLFAVFAAAVAARRANRRLEVGWDGVTIHRVRPAEPLHVSRERIAEAVAGPGPALVLVLNAPLRVGEEDVDHIPLAVVDPQAAAAALAAVGVPVDVTEPTQQDRRPRRRRLTAVLAVFVGLCVVAAALGDEHKDRTPPRFAPVPDVPEASARYHETPADGTAVWAWRTSTTTVRVRIDTLAAKCSGADWQEDDHTTDLHDLRLDADGAFTRRARVLETYWAGGVDVVTVLLRGRITDRHVTGTMQRVDDNRGTYTGVCRTTVRFAAPRE